MELGNTQITQHGKKSVCFERVEAGRHKGNKQTNKQKMRLVDLLPVPHPDPQTPTPRPQAVVVGVLSAPLALALVLVPGSSSSRTPAVLSETWVMNLWEGEVSQLRRSWILTSHQPPTHVGSPLDESRIKNSFTPVQNTSHHFTSLPSSLIQH